MTLTHNEVQDAAIDWVRSDGARARISRPHWIPDFSFVFQGIGSVYEVKPELINRSELRHGLVQALDGFMYGYKSYLIISDKYISEVNRYLPYFPQIGIISYSRDKDFTIVVESGIPYNNIEASKNICLYTLSNVEKEDDFVIIGKSRNGKSKRGRPATAVKVDGYSYIKNGKTVTVPRYNRKKSKKRNIS